VKGVILAAGRGTRMLPLTRTRPKPLVPVLNRPLIEYVLLGLREAGADEFAVVIGHLGDQIQAALGDGSRLGVSIHYLVQPEPNGSGAATLLAEEFIGGEPFLLSFADIITPRRNYPRLREAFDSGRWSAVITLNWMEDPYEGAAVTVDDEGRVLRIVEKPPKGTAGTHFNNAGIFILPPFIFDAIRSTPKSDRGEYELPQAIQFIIEQEFAVGGVEIDGYRSDVARPSEILKLSRDMWAADELADVTVGAGSQVDSQARIVPPVLIGGNCRIGACHIGPHVSVGDRVALQDGAVLRDAAVFDDVTIAEDALVEYAIIVEGLKLPCGERVVGTGDKPFVLAT